MNKNQILIEKLLCTLQFQYLILLVNNKKNSSQNPGEI